MKYSEIVCSFMEPKPTSLPSNKDLALYYSNLGSTIVSEGGWWQLGRRPHMEPGIWYPIELDLNNLHKVEAKLIDDQWWKYEAFLGVGLLKPLPLLEIIKLHIHANAKQKIEALGKALYS